jgi:hypothetical protein
MEANFESECIAHAIWPTLFIGYPTLFSMTATHIFSTAIPECQKWPPVLPRFAPTYEPTAKEDMKLLVGIHSVRWSSFLDVTLQLRKKLLDKFRS